MWLDSKANSPPSVPSAGSGVNAVLRLPGPRKDAGRGHVGGLRLRPPRAPSSLPCRGRCGDGPAGGAGERGSGAAHVGCGSGALGAGARGQRRESGVPGARAGGDVTATALFGAAGSWRRSGVLLARPCSQWARGGQRPGGHELRRLLGDELAPAPGVAGRLELLYGLSPCLLALRAARRRVARLLLLAGRSGLQGERAELLREAEARDIPVLRPRRQRLDALCRHQVHQGVCMEVSPLRPEPWTEVGDARPQDASQQLWLVLEGLQDPRNLGAVLRSAHFLGVDKIITSRKNSCPLTPVVSKASAGAMEVMTVFSTDDLAGFLQAKARQGWLVAGTVGCTPATSHRPEIPVTSCLEFRWDRPTLLVLGNEGAGLSPEAQASCQLLLTVLPGRQLTPGLESLNVSVAAGILLHSICSQRKEQRGRPAQDSPESSATLKSPE